MQATELKILLQNVYLIKGLYPEYIKNSYKLSDKKTTKKWMKDLNRYFTKKINGWQVSTWKKCSTSLVPREMQNKISPPLEWLKKRLAKPGIGKNVGAID